MIHKINNKPKEIPDYKIVSVIEGYCLYQHLLTKQLFVSVPTDHNDRLRIYDNSVFYFIELSMFIRAGTKSCIYEIINTSKLIVDFDLFYKSKFTLNTNKSLVTEHSTYLYGFSELTIEKDNETGQALTKIISDKDGNSFTIESNYIHGGSNQIGHPPGYLACGMYEQDKYRITVNAFEPSSTFYYAATCLSAVVYFAKKVRNIN